MTRNAWHSCRRDRIAAHLDGKPRTVRDLYRRFVAVARQNGPMTVYAQKSRIVFQVRARFAGAVIRRGWIEGAVWLKRRLEHPRFHRILSVTPRDHVHYFRVARVEDLDDDVRRWLAEAYLVGSQAAAAGGRGQPLHRTEVAGASSAPRRASRSARTPRR